MAFVTAAQWASFNAEGYLRLGTVATPTMLASLQQRIDEIMLCTAPVDYKRMLMQLDSADGAYESAGVQNKGFKGETLNYRKIEQLEEDPIFLAYMQLPIFAEIARHMYGDVPIAAFRAMFMNKPAHRGTHLPLHQDHWRALDRNPLITIYTALDAADETNGCVELIPGTPWQGAESTPSQWFSDGGDGRRLCRRPQTYAPGTCSGRSRTAAQLDPACQWRQPFQPPPPSLQRLPDGGRYHEPAV